MRIMNLHLMQRKQNEAPFNPQNWGVVEKEKWLDESKYL